MKVHELIARLQEQPQDAEVYYGSFHNFLNDDFKYSRAITDKERTDVYDLDFEFKTVYHWSIPEDRYIPFTGVIFEIDG